MSAPQRYRCAACGNRTRFDVIERKRTRSFYHFTLGGDVTIEEEEPLDHEVERVVCRWCGTSDQIETQPGAPDAANGISVEAQE